MQKLAVGIASLLLLFSSTGASALTYFIDRTVGNGSVTGFIETDGTLGVLANSNIVSWQIMVAAPNLNGGLTDQFGSNVPPAQLLFGFGSTATTATATSLFFDFDSPTPAYQFAQGGNSNFWCLEAANSRCAVENSPSPLETIGRPPENSGATTNYTELQVRSGVVAFATVAAVPEPETYAMMIVGLGLLGVVARRRRLK